jgi:hypothetical protein
LKFDQPASRKKPNSDAAGAEVIIGQVYCDYTPANLLFENDQLSLVDPPDVFLLLGSQEFVIRP